MCTGMEIAALVATVGGSVIQNRSRNKALDRQQSAAEAELLRQGRFDEEKFANFQAALAGADRDKQQGTIDEAVTDIEADVAANVRSPGSEGTYEPASGRRAPRVVQEYAEDKQSEADDFVAMLGNAQARRGAWGDNQFNFVQQLLDKQFDHRQIQTNLERSQAIGNQETINAGRPGAGAAIGNALVGLGTAGMGYAGAQPGAFGSLFGGSGSVIGTGAAAGAGAGVAAGAGNALGSAFRPPVAFTTPLPHQPMFTGTPI